ncbi:uncharacterized protein LOC135332176 [Halichondria panicea]|uniref:uncharacterized protein LOC135332176 n=1 Tax=Halichondria panicea TaxID=6063 RepID=UPI00312BAC09
MSKLQQVCDVEVELTRSDAEEKKEVHDFCRKECGCSLWKQKCCSLQFSVHEVEDVRSQCASLSHDELDMVLLGQIMATSNNRDTVVTASGHKKSPRQKAYTRYFHQGLIVCAKMFLFFHGVSRTRMKALAQRYKENGLTPRIHGNTKRSPKWTLSLSSAEFVVGFLVHYTQLHGLLLPGRVPGYSRSDLKLLPSSATKRSIWIEYHQSAINDSSIHTVVYSTFCRLWRTLLPQVLIMKPMSDLCWQCQQNSTAIIRSANSQESDKSSTLKAAEDHLTHVQLERSYYRAICDDCRQEVRTCFTENGTFSPPLPHSGIPANTKRIKVHYSFDYAQQVHYPCDPLQPGPIFFLTPRKCSIFGVHCEAIPRQVNFLGDEAGDCGKGANTVISQLHYYFEHHGLGETEVYLHADNCTGQNKNSCMIHYLCWRCMTGRHTKATISFMVVGHTKFAPDWCFGLLKQRYRRTRIGCLTDIATVVNQSAVCNVSQLVIREDGTTVVPVFDWTSFFAVRMKKLTGIKKFHHFYFDSAKPGEVVVKVRSDSAETKYELLKQPWTPDPQTLPDKVPPRGLSSERQWYLYEKIRPFCPFESQDVTCPLPTAPRPTSRHGTPATTPPPPESSQPPAKKRRCGLCRQEGHVRTVCPQRQD